MKNVIKLSSTELAQRVVKIKICIYVFSQRFNVDSHEIVKELQLQKKKKKKKKKKKYRSATDERLTRIIQSILFIPTLDITI